MEVGLDEISQFRNFKIHPNPSSGLVKIEFPHDNLSDWRIKVTSTEGKILETIEREKVMKKDYQLDLKNYPTGIYQIILKIEGHQITKKLVIVK